MELDATACRTRAAAGLHTIRADVTQLPLEPFGGCEGMWASPPCQAFSMAGNGDGRAILDELCADAYARRWGRDLVLEPLRWTLAIRPRWLAWEQVPPVLPIWQACAHVLEREGYRTWVGLLRAEQWGVPQTRTRAILMAHRDRPVLPPTPTHQRYVPGRPADPTLSTLFGAGLLPWISMAEALGGMSERPFLTLATAGGKRGGADEQVGGSKAREVLYRERDSERWVVDRRTNSKDGRGGMVPSVPRSCGTPAPTLTGKAGTWVLRHDAQENATVRHLDEPAGTLKFAHALNDVSWTTERPATSVMGDPRIAQPGRHDPTESGSQQRDAIRITIEEALILQGVPHDFPVQGTRTAQFRQVGNCVPPALAEAIVRSLA